MSRSSVSPFIDSLPESHGPAREAAILAEVVRREQGGLWTLADVSWSNVSLTVPGGGRAVIPVMTDALRVDGVRVSTNFRTAQQIADVLGVVLATPHVVNEAARQATARILPSTHSQKGGWMDDGTASRTSRMIEHSVEVDYRLAQTSGGLVDNAGKWWVNTSRNWENPAHGANYGWFLKSGPIQTVGMAHNLSHVDYSQTLRYMGPVFKLIRSEDTGNVTVEELDTAEALTSPLLAAILNPPVPTSMGREGALALARHPAIPVYRPPIA